LTTQALSQSLQINLFAIRRNANYEVAETISRPVTPLHSTPFYPVGLDPFRWENGAHVDDPVHYSPDSPLFAIPWFFSGPLS